MLLFVLCAHKDFINLALSVYLVLKIAQHAQDQLNAPLSKKAQGKLQLSSMEWLNQLCVIQVAKNALQQVHLSVLYVKMDIVYRQTQFVWLVTQNVKLVEVVQQLVLLVMGMHSFQLYLLHLFVCNVIVILIAKPAYKLIHLNVLLAHISIICRMKFAFP